MQTEYKVISPRKPFRTGDILIHDSDTDMIYLASNPFVSMSFEYAKAINLPIINEKDLGIKVIDVEQKEYDSVAELFKGIRKRNKINQATWSELTGLSRTSIVNIEQGIQSDYVGYINKWLEKTGYEVVLKVRKKKIKT